MGTVTRLHPYTTVDHVCLRVRAIAYEQGFNRAFVAYADLVARCYLTGVTHPIPHVTQAVATLRRDPRESRAQYEHRVHRNPLAGVVLDGINSHADLAHADLAATAD